jgi:hypothetical protein
MRNEDKWAVAFIALILITGWALLIWALKAPETSVQGETVRNELATVKTRLDILTDIRSDVRKEVTYREKNIKETLDSLPDSALVDRLNRLISE